jgi:hypothetical protein
LSTHRKDEASRGDNAFIFNFDFQSLRVNNVVTFSIERHVLLREFFFLFSDLACFFIFKAIQARLKCTCLVQKKQSKLVFPASSQIHVTSVFRIATSSSSPTSSLPRSQLQEKDYSFLTIVASSNRYKRREQISLSLVPRHMRTGSRGVRQNRFCYFDAKSVKVCQTLFWKFLFKL